MKVGVAKQDLYVAQEMLARLRVKLRIKQVITDDELHAVEMRIFGALGRLVRNRPRNVRMGRGAAD
jgi:hypothetical protein